MITKSSTTISKESTLGENKVETGALFYFYKLVDPFDNKTKYIGRTVSLENRFRNHIYEAKKNRRNKREKWLIKLIRKNKLPLMKVIYKEKCTLEKAIDLERMYVKLYSKYYDLKNSPDNYLGVVLTGKPVYQYKLNGDFVEGFKNSNQAFIKTKIKDSNILRCCKNQNGYGSKTAGGYFWSFDKYKKYPFVYIQNWRNLKGKPVCQYDLQNNLILTYNTARKASEKTGVSYKKISACCNGRQKTAGGYIWKFKQ